MFSFNSQGYTLTFRNSFYRDEDTYINNELDMMKPTALSQKYLDKMDYFLSDQKHLIAFPGFSQLEGIFNEYELGYISIDKAIDKMQYIVDIAS